MLVCHKLGFIPCKEKSNLSVTALSLWAGTEIPRGYMRAYMHSSRLLAITNYDRVRGGGFHADSLVDGGPDTASKNHTRLIR